MIINRYAFFCRNFVPMFGKFKYHILLHVIIFMWGFTGILGKKIQLEALPLVWHRVGIAVIALILGMYFLKRSFSLPSKKNFVGICLTGVVVALHWVTFYESIQLSTASLGILCLSTTTIHVAWLEPVLMKRKFNWTEFIFGAIVIYGIYFVSGDFSTQEYKALAYGLSSAFFAAVFSVFNAKFAETMAPSKITLYELIAGFVFLSFVLMLRGEATYELFVIDTESLLWLIFLGVLCTSFAFLATIEVLKHLGAFTVSLSINLEPVYTIILAIILLNENEFLSPNFYIGSALIVVVVIGNALLKSHQTKRALRKL
jgi:drug/metabolite transporter (DMT)-like permease